MNTKTKMLVVKGDTNCGKTTILKKLSQYLQDELGYILLSHTAPGNPDKDICDLLQNESRKLVYISTMGDYLKTTVWPCRLTTYNICDLVICACNNNWTKVIEAKIPEAQYFEKEKNKQFFDEQDLQKLAEMVTEICG